MIGTLQIADVKIEISIKTFLGTQEKRFSSEELWEQYLN